MLEVVCNFRKKIKFVYNFSSIFDVWLMVEMDVFVYIIFSIFLFDGIDNMCFIYWSFLEWLERFSMDFVCNNWYLGVDNYFCLIFDSVVLRCLYEL